MSSTTTPATSTQVAVNDAIATAKNLPDLIQKAQAIDPTLAAALSGKALIASKSPWGTLLAGGVAYLAGKYGLGWSEATCDLVAGAGVLLGSYLMRYLSPGRITGLINKTPVIPDATTQGTKT